MSQFQSQVPGPLGYHLPALLSPGRMRAPAIRLDLLVLIKKRRLKGPAMQIQFDDIGGGECLLRQGCGEEFVDDTSTRDANRTLLFRGGVWWPGPPALRSPPALPGCLVSARGLRSTCTL